MFRRLPQQGGTPRDIAEIVNRILDGKINSVADVTIDTSLAPVTVTDARVGEGSLIVLMPFNSAATQLSNHIYVSAVANGSFTVSLRSGHGNHVANYRYAVLG
jgi:hypothetical protein